MNNGRHFDRFKDAFQAVVIELYMEQRRTHGAHQAINYEKVLTRTPGGHCQRVVRPTMSDFLSDVEITAKRALDENLFALFRAICINQTRYFDELTSDQREAIEQKMGRLLIRRGIHPSRRYFLSKDCR